MKLKVFDIGSQTQYDVCFGRLGNKEVCYRKADLRYQLDANRWQWICNAEASNCARETSESSEERESLLLSSLHR